MSERENTPQFIEHILSLNPDYFQPFSESLLRVLLHTQLAEKLTAEQLTYLIKINQIKDSLFQFLMFQ